MFFRAVSAVKRESSRSGGAATRFRWQRVALAGCALFATLSAPVFAQPAGRRITLIVPAAAGGSTDVIARVVGDHMSRTLGDTVTIENVPGGGTTLGSERVASASPDGSTVLINQLALLAAPSLLLNLRYDTRIAFSSVGLINTGPTVVVARKNLASSPADSIAWLRANGDKTNIGHGGLGTSGHLCGLILARALGIKPTFVAYRGGAPAMNDLMVETIDILCDQSANAIPQIEAGTVRGVLVASGSRLANIPDVPNGAELGLPELDLAVWHGLYVPRATPRSVVERLNAALQAALREPAVLDRFRQLGTVPFAESLRSPEAHDALFQAELARVGRLLSEIGIKPQSPQ